MEAPKEIQDKVNAIMESAKNECKNILFYHAAGSSPYKSGDIIEDHYHIIKVEKITVVISSNLDSYEINYKGVELTKKLIPTKKQQNTVMFGLNVQRKIQ